MKGTLRITKQEEVALQAEFGSVGKGLRVLLDAHRRHVDGERDPLEPMVAVDRVLDVVEAAVEAIAPTDLEVTRAAGLEVMPTFIPEPDRLHRHKRKTLLRTDFAQGTKVQVWACECGAELR